MERGLYIVPTPIGNLGDVSQRAIDVLRAVELIAAEDTRHCRKLLNQFGIESELTAFHDHSDEKTLDRLCDRIENGAAIALVSDAGTPLISDPGYSFVRALHIRGLPVVPLPGPCAAIVALSASGLPTDRFYFEGFLPSRSSARCERLSKLRSVDSTLVFYEAPHRIVATLTDLVTVLGAHREAALARELTKAFETVRFSILSDLLAWVSEDANQQRGEIVVVVAGATMTPAQQIDAMRVLERLARVMPPRKAAAMVAELSGFKARDLYQYLLEKK